MSYNLWTKLIDGSVPISEYKRGKDVLYVAVMITSLTPGYSTVKTITTTHNIITTYIDNIFNLGINKYTCDYN